MRLLYRLQVNVFNLVSRPCTDDRMMLPHLTISTMNTFTSVEEPAERTKNILEDLP